MLRKAKVPASRLKRQAFITEFLKDFNGTRAAVRAGYAARSAEVTASRLLADPRVAHEIREFQLELQSRVGVSTERVINELACVAFADPRQVFGANGEVQELSQLSEPVARSISSFERKTRTLENGATATTTVVRFWSKVDALQTIARVLGMLKDKVEHSGNDGKPIRVSFGGRYQPDGKVR